jgi:hypothetical protein
MMTPSQVFLAAWVLTEGQPFHVRLKAMLDRKWYEQAAQWLTALNNELMRAAMETDKDSQVNMAMIERATLPRLHS